MAIPYNPSSFNSNKTILQAIEELKKYLQENPCYKIYMYNDNYVDGTYVYDKSGVDDPDSIEAYDVIFFANSYYSKVESVGDSAITVWPAINFTGAEGPEGPEGPAGADGTDGTDGTDGADGVSIVNVGINASQHLIVMLSDGNTIDAGLIPSPSDHYIELTNNTGTLSDDDYAILQYKDSFIDFQPSANTHNLFKKSTENAAYMYFTIITGASGVNRFIIDKNTKAYSTDTQGIQDGAIDSETATNGQVLTANGSGGASWVSPSTPAVEGTAVKSTGETSGKVLTADGSGGASWQTAGGGSLYVHTINFTRNSTNSKIEAQFEILSTSSTLLTSLQISQYLNANYRDSKYKMCSGVYWDGTDFFSIASVFNNSGVVAVRYLNTSGNVWVFSINDGILTFTDQGAVLVS